MTFQEDTYTKFAAELQKLAAFHFQGALINLDIQPITRRIEVDGMPTEASFPIVEGYAYTISIK